MADSSNSNTIVNISKIIIQGVTSTGDVFRPSDWAERLSGRLATFRNQRVIYSPLLRPGVKDGQKCVIMAPQIKELHPELYDYLMNFAQTNDLTLFWE
jgi:hypothetical protein